MEHLIFAFATLFTALIFGTILGWYAKYVLRNRKLTQTFSLVAIISTVAFVIWAMIYLE